MGASREGDVPSAITVDMLGADMLNDDATLDVTLNTEPSREAMPDGGLVKGPAVPLPPAQISTGDGGPFLLMLGTLGSMRFKPYPHLARSGSAAGVTDGLKART